LRSADQGTLFLDEVGDLPLGMQVKLLRVIQEKRVRRVGDTQEEPIDVRIISATHRSLSEQVDAGEFRQDLFYRLNVIEMKMPSLREIPEDIPLMVAEVLARLARQSGTASPTMAEDAMMALRRYDFPGNVRELENILERALALCSDNTILVGDLYLTQGGTKEKSPALDGARTTRGCRCTTSSTRSSARPSPRRSRPRFNKTAAASSSASPSARCATAWIAWGSIEIGVNTNFGCIRPAMLAASTATCNCS
jgi:two-component system response regulator PilR (NtrC family)